MTSVENLERIAAAAGITPDQAAAALEELNRVLAGYLATFRLGGRHTRAGWTVEMIRMIAESQPSEATHDIYAWTPHWDGKAREVYNCTLDPQGNSSRPGEFESVLGAEIDLAAPWNGSVIYFFGEKVSE